MSGIAGIIRFDGAPLEPGLIEKMTAAMSYRGPDGINHWRKGSVALGQCMLRTTPESLEEIQPLANEDESLVLVMGGRVDNWLELRRELLGRGAVLRTQADAELVLRAFETWGGECLPHIDGDFAFVIWSPQAKTAFCARDRMGNKPFHYHWDGKTFVFATDLHAVLSLPWVEQTPNQGMLSEFLAAEWYSRDETLWQGIMRLIPAYLMQVDRTGPRTRQYWHPDLWTALPYKKDEEYVEHYRDLLLDSVRRLSRSHKSLAIEVSGGLDSSAVLCIAEHLRRIDKLSAPKIEPYTLAFTDDKAANETAFARAVGDYLGVRIPEIPPSIPALSWYESRARSNPGCPAFPNGIMLQGLRQRASEQGCRVSLNGIGGDEWLTGSRLYYAEAISGGDWKCLQHSFRQDIENVGVQRSVIWLLRYGVYPVMPLSLQAGLLRLLRRIRGGYTKAYFWLTPTQKARILKRRQAHNRVLQRQPVRLAGQWELLDIFSAGFRDIAREEDERLNAAFGLEARRPLDTSEFVQFAFSTPERLRLRGDSSKYIHRQALQGLMPQAILERQNKAEFSTVFRGYMDQLQHELTSGIPARHTDWVTSEGMTQLFEIYSDKPHIGWPIWVLWSIYGCDNLLASCINR